MKSETRTFRISFPPRFMADWAPSVAWCSRADVVNGRSLVGVGVRPPLSPPVGLRETVVTQRVANCTT